MQLLVTTIGVHTVRSHERDPHTNNFECIGKINLSGMHVMTHVDFHNGPGRTTGGHFWIKGGRNVVGRRARREENITSVMSQGVFPIV